MRATLLAVVVAAAPAFAQTVTVKGQVRLQEKDTPAAVVVNVTADKEHCLGKGPLADDSIIVNPKTRGLKNVWVYVRAAGGAPLAVTDIPKAAGAKEHVIDQPCCQFVPRVLAVRDGDTLKVKNSAPVPHNIKYDSDTVSFNQTVPAGGEFKAPQPFAVQKAPVEFSCSIHPWMKGRVMIFDHPFFALTDADGMFEIKDVPAKDFSITYRHEAGYHKGKEGAKGFDLKLAGKNGVVELPAIDFQLPK
jgi:plastocyanin